MNFADVSIDHSKLEDISYSGGHSDDEDEIYLSDEDKDNIDEYVKDTFANETVVANKKCKIYPKSRHYAVVRFGDGYADRAIALPKVIFHEDEMIDGEKMMTNISWGHDGWINARRDPFSSVKWKATLLWTGMRKPAGFNSNVHHDNQLWRLLLQEYQDLGDVDVSMNRVALPTLKSVADDLNTQEKLVGGDGRNCLLSKDCGAHPLNRKYSNMLEDIDVLLKDKQRSEHSGCQSDYTDDPHNHPHECASKTTARNVFVADSKSLEPIASSDSTEPQLIKNIGGKVKQVTESFVCVEPTKPEYQSKEPYPVMSHSFYFANGKRGDSYMDLTKSDLKANSDIKMNIAKINGKWLVISSWEYGAKPPKNDEAKAIEWAKRIRQKSQKTTSVVTHGKLEEPTPQSQMSARPHSPSYFQLNEIRAPSMTSAFSDCKPTLAEFWSPKLFKRND